jgi:hypothetical protein
MSLDLKKPATNTQLIILGVIGIIATIVFLSSNDSSPKKQNSSGDTEVVATPLVIDEGQLVHEYEANEVRADSAYKGKTVSVSGYVDYVGKDILNHAFVLLRSGEGQVGQVQCVLRPAAIDQASTLNPGQAVTLTGRVEGKMMNVVIEDCSF